MSGSAAAGDGLIRDVAMVARRLRARGAEAGPDRVVAAVQALAAVDGASPEQSYWTLRCTLISRYEDIEAFDSAFDALDESCWEPSDGMPSEVPIQRKDGREPVCESPDEQLEDRADDDAAGAGEPDHDERNMSDGMSWSAQERLRELDFSACSETELRAIGRLMAELGDSLPRRRTRRLRAGREGAVLDTRRTLRSAMRADGLPIERHWRHPRVALRKLVFVIDVSGSMAPYARAVTMFVQAAVRAARTVEAFAFGTRLTRLTTELRARDPDRALEAAARAVPDWAGGTRIGENIRLLNDVWGNRGVTRGAVVVVLSDGLERGNRARLTTEMARLARCAHTVIWVNPLAGEADYEPLAHGMAAALPYVDHFLPGHNLRSLEELAGLLEALPTERSRRKAAPGAGL